MEDNVEFECGLKNEMAEIPLGDIQKLREKVGIKKFNLAFSKQQPSNSSTEAVKEQFKRANKHRPREMSSKKPVSRFRQVVEVRRKDIRRDPRFDDRCGHLNQDLFSKSFSFLEEIRSREANELKKDIKKKAKDPAKRENLQRMLKKVESDVTNTRQQTESQTLVKEHRSMERQVMKTGRKPFYLSKALQKKVLLAQKYKELKKSGKLRAFISKKRKRNAARDRKRLPL